MVETHFSTNPSKTFVAETSPLFPGRQCKHSSNMLILPGLDLVSETWKKEDMSTTLFVLQPQKRTICCMANSYSLGR